MFWYFNRKLWGNVSQIKFYAKLNKVFSNIPQKRLLNISSPELGFALRFHVSYFFLFTIFIINLSRNHSGVENVLVSRLLKHFWLMFLFYTPWKYQKIRNVYDIFRGYGVGTLARNGLKDYSITHSAARCFISLKG